MSEFIKDRLGDIVDNIVNGEFSEPDMLLDLPNMSETIEMLDKAILNRSKILIHTDVDMDGIGSAFLMERFMRAVGARGKCDFIINKERIHGIQEKHTKYVNNSNTELMIILDSGTNDIEYIKNMNCDVLVIDHHEITHTELSGNTSGGKYIILNNMNGTYEQKDMSCGLLVYEVIRVFEHIKQVNIVTDTSLYQWACITLISDIILLANNRNQYYMNKMLNDSYIEPCLKVIIDSLSGGSKYKSSYKLSKSFISFSLVPRVNSAIREGQSAFTLDTILNNPSNFGKLDEFKNKQADILERLESGENSCKIRVNDEYAILNVDDVDINKNYCGVIASKIKDKYRVNTVVYSQDEQGVSGSFRGCNEQIDYRSLFERCNIDAKGHSIAFGIKANSIEDIEKVLKGIHKYVDNKKSREYLTAGNLKQEDMGEYHILDMGKFKSCGNLVKLAIVNSMVSNEESIEIIASSNEVNIDWKSEKFGIAEFMGIQCKIFREINTEFVSIYVEYDNSDGVQAYIREYTK